MGHQVWVLLIGDQHFIESRYPSGGNGQIGFAVTEAQYAGLERGEPLLAYYRSPPLTDAAIVAPPGGRYCGDF